MTSIYFHTTDQSDAILSHGFKDRTGFYGLGGLEMTGVWLADRPLDINEGATGDEVLQVEIADSVDLSDYEIVEDLKPYREWCIPAELVNANATVTREPW